MATTPVMRLTHPQSDCPECLTQTIVEYAYGYFKPLKINDITAS
ncbi:MAG: hypothetical protein AAGD09_24025 [Cyanobacteria bacterium P01_F01_bin.56]